LVDFDMLYGHRRDPQGYARALMEFDAGLQALLERLRKSDLLLITADHGCDPTFTETTDHTREYVPILSFSKSSIRGGSLGVRESFADVAATLGDVFQVKSAAGKSFYPQLEITAAA